MTSKELKRLTRSDLLEILLSVSEENERLQAQLEEQKTLVDARLQTIEHIGSISEAVIYLNDVFGNAQKACDHYQATVSLRMQKMEEESRLLLQQTQEACARMEQETREKCEKMLAQAAETVRQAEALAQELRESFVEQNTV